MRVFSIAGALISVLLLTAAPSRAEVQLTMQNGRVTLVAKDATVRQILTEWARVGQTKIVNIERLQGGPLTLQLKDVPEQQALEAIMRSVSGYLAALRAVAVPNASRFDRILVMQAVAVPPPAPVAQARPAPRPGFVVPQPPPDEPQDQPIENDAEREQRPVPPSGQRPRGPLFNVFPPPQVVNPEQGPPTPDSAGSSGPAAGVAYPGAPTTATPAGVAVPGMIVPVPQPPPGSGAPSDRPSTERD
jgi:hypothetical protein